MVAPALPAPADFFLVVFLAGVVVWRLRLDFLCFFFLDEWWCLVLPFDGCLEPGVGDELDGCLCGAPGPVVVVVVGVVVVAFAEQRVEVDVRGGVAVGGVTVARHQRHEQQVGDQHHVRSVP